MSRLATTSYQMFIIVLIIDDVEIVNLTFVHRPILQSVSTRSSLLHVKDELIKDLYGLDERDRFL